MSSSVVKDLDGPVGDAQVVGSYSQPPGVFRRHLAKPRQQHDVGVVEGDSLLGFTRVNQILHPCVREVHATPRSSAERRSVDGPDEGGRRYTAGVVLEALWVIVTEARSQRSMEGRKPVERISLAVSARTLDSSGISDPEDYARHLNDVIRYQGRLWEIKEYNIKGSIPDAVIIGVVGTQIYEDEEMVFDDLPQGMRLGSLNRTMSYPNNTTSTFVEHDGPGEYTVLYTSLDG